MSSFTEKIDQCLDKICGHLSDAGVLVELVQSLARQLRLDTFVDPEAYTHVVSHGFENDGVAFKRLSIAGSFILIDIDFIEEDNFLKVTLSLANHDGTNENTNKEDEMGIDEEGSANRKEDTIFYGTKEKNSIEQASHEREDSVENILYHNLREPTLGNFPSNLKFLTILDRLSSAEQNYFYQLNKIASFLKFINGFRCTQESWEFKEGYKGNLGQVYLNDKKEGRVGILLKFWRDFRLFERELGLLKEMQHFKTYEALLTMDASPKDSQENDLATEDMWCLGVDEDYKHLQVVCPGDSLLNRDISGVSSLSFCLAFNEPVCLPVQLLEFLVISHWETTSEATKGLELFGNLKEDKEYESSTIKNMNICLSERAIQNYVSVTKMKFYRLSVLPKLISMVRNFLLLKNLLYSCVRDLAKKKIFSRRGSMFEYAPSDADNKLKEALQLFDGLSNDEMMALNATKNAPASFLMEGDNSMDLQSFLSENDDPTSETTIRSKSFAHDKPYIKVSLDEIDLSSLPYALVVSVNGCIIKDEDKKVEIQERFRIVNGGIFPYTREDSTMHNDQSFSSKFIKGLKITEDIVLTLKKILPIELTM